MYSLIIKLISVDFMLFIEKNIQLFASTITYFKNLYEV